MLRMLPNQDELKRQYRAFRGNAVGIVMRLENRALAHQFRNLEDAKNFIEWIIEYQFFQPSDEGTLEPIIEMRQAQTVFAVHLTDDIMDSIMGAGHFENEALKSSTANFHACILSKRVEKIHLVLGTEYFKNNTSLQKRFLATYDALGHSLLQTAIIEFSSENVTLFLNAFDKDVLQEAMLLKSDDQTVLAFAMTITYNNAFAQLHALATDETIKQALDANPKMLPAIFEQQSPATIAAFLQRKMALDDIKLFLTPRLIYQIADCVLHDANWQDNAVVEAVFELAGKTIAPMIYRAWIHGQEISEALQQAALAHQGESSFAEEKAFIQYEATTNDALLKANAFHHITTQKGTIIELATFNANHMETIRQEGFASLQDYRILRKVQDNVVGLRETLDLLYYTNHLYTGVAHPPAAEEKNIPSFAEIQSLIAQENALLQKVPLERFHEITAQLSDYTYRPHQHTDKTDAKLYKFNHLKNTIEEYKSHPANAPHDTQHTQKWPMTHITSACNNAISGENDTEHALIYLLHDKQHGVIKAMLNHSHITGDRPWIGSKREVEDYADNEGAYNKTDFKVFNQEAKEQPYLLNKVLFKTTREAVKAIVIPQDTPIARQLARVKASELAKMNIPVAIVFYDRVLHQFRPYLAEEIALDYANENANALRQAIQEKTEEDFIAYFETITDASTLMLHQAAPNTASALHLAAQKYPENALHLMLTKLPANAGEMALLELTDENNMTVLQIAMQHQSTIENVLSLLRLSSLEAKIVSETHDYAYLVFHAADYLSEANLIAFIRYLSSGNNQKVLEKALTVQNKEHYSALYYAAQKLTPDHFEKLFEVLPETVLSEACKVEIEIHGEPDVNEFKREKIDYLTLLNAMLEHQSPENIVTLLITINDSAFDYLLFREDREEVCQPLIKQIIDGLLQEEEVDEDDTAISNPWLNTRLINRLLAHPQFSPLLIKAIAAHWLEGNEINEPLQSLAQRHLNQQPISTLSGVLKEFMNYKAEEKEDYDFFTSKNTPFRLNENRVNLLKLLWEEGLLEINAYRLLRKDYSHIIGMIEVLNNLRDMNAITTGLPVPYQVDEHNLPKILNIAQLTEETAKQRLLALQEKMDKANLSTLSSLFGMKSKPNTVINIELQIQNAKNNKQSWLQAEAAVNEALKRAETTKSRSRYPTTAQFYEEAKNHMATKKII